MAEKTEQITRLVVVKADVVPGTTPEELLDILNWRIDIGSEDIGPDIDPTLVKFTAAVDVTQPGTFDETLGRM
jgi:hypothetical protein